MSALSSFTLNDDIPLICTLCNVWNVLVSIPKCLSMDLVVPTHVPVATCQTADVRVEKESSANRLMEYNTEYD